MSGLVARASGLRRGIAFAAGLVMAGGLASYGGLAGAAPQPTVSQVQAKIDKLTSQFDQVSVQLDRASQQLSAAQSGLAQVRTRLQHANAQFQAARAAVAQTAAAAFEDTGATSVAGILTSGDPTAILRQGALLLEQSGNRSAQARQLLASASELAAAEQQMQRTETGIAALNGQLAGHKRSLGQLIDTEKATLASLTVPQQQTVQTNSIGANGTTQATYTGPTNTQAEKAVAFAYAQLGKPYQWGATGPGSYDCSGLVQAAWASGGVAIPRTTYEQWATLPHIATSAVQPGDLLYMDGIGHVVMYVGGGYIIDAPQTVISQAALISHLSTDQATELRQLVAAARALTTARQSAARTAYAVAALQRQQLARRKAVAAAVAKQKSLLSTLTAQQQATVTVAAGGSTTGSYTGSTATQAGKAVAFAYAQLGKPYVFGATGPSSYDCSGLVQAAWAAAGVSIPRDTYSQWAALPHVPMSAIQPGDLIFFDAEGHVGIYVGGNMIIDAPQPGLSVEKVSLSDSWYASNLDGAARP